MASRNRALGGPDSVDVLAVLTAFEEINQCRIRIELFTQTTTKLAVMHVVATAVEFDHGLAAPKQLGCQKLFFGFHTPVRLESVILQALYKLDAELGAAEFAKADKKP